MALAGGQKLGPYEILEQIGAGGMGEVYRAKDPRLGREIAIKVLPAFFDPDRLRRFEREAQAAGSLNHPNITAVHDIGTQDGAPYVVMELLKGETLRQRLASGALPVRKAIDYAVQIARGLAAAHEASIIHRDLKPENLFVTQDGRVKILDFGLAKLTQTDRESMLSQGSTATQNTEPGVVLGTLGYMSPEQVKGLPADARSDIFSLGAVLYEMLSGKRAFRGDSAAETMSAILKEDPPELSATNKDVSPGLERIVRHCLEKGPGERIHSAHDLAFDLEVLWSVSGPAVPVEGVAAARKRSLSPLLLAVAAVVAVALGISGFLTGKKAGYVPPPSFQRLTFSRGELVSARFSPDGQSVFYSAAWDGKPMEIFSTRIDHPEPRAFGLPGADLMAISDSGKMAVSLNRYIAWVAIRSGTLAEISISGGVAPRELLAGVHWADWAPDGSALAIVRDVEQRSRLEYPVGKVLYQTLGYLSHPRVSRDGNLVAFLEHPARNQLVGSVGLVDKSGQKRTLYKVLGSEVWGLAWSPDGREVWFTATRPSVKRALCAVSLSGKQRLLARVPQSLTLQDVAPDGRVLVANDTVRVGILAKAPGAEKERELGWRTFSAVADISDDGMRVLFTEQGEGSSPGFDVYVRATDGSPPMRLGEGEAGALSPDGKWALAHTAATEKLPLVLYSIGADEKRVLPTGELAPEFYAADFLPDGKTIVFTASEPGHGTRLFLIEVEGGKPRPLSPEGFRCFLRGVSPDGRFVVAFGPDQKLYLYPLEGGEPTVIPGLSSDDIPVWSADGRFLYVFRRSDVPLRVYKLEVATGKKELWKAFIPADPAGISDLWAHPTPDGRAYTYEYTRTLSDLYVVHGIK